MVNVAMFDAVNCIEPHYQPNKMQVEPSPDTSQDAAAASAAANVLMQVVASSTLKATLSEYLAKIPDGPAKDRDIKLKDDGPRLCRCEDDRRGGSYARGHWVKSCYLAASKAERGASKGVLGDCRASRSPTLGRITAPYPVRFARWMQMISVRPPYRPSSST
jgi:hypothetical protein